MSELHCPDCGNHTLRLIEDTEPDGAGEYKEVRTCDECENIVYIVRHSEEPPDDEPQEGDLTTEDHAHFYQYGKLVLTVSDVENMEQEVRDFMEREGFYPNVWFISDHGNCHLITLDQ